MFEAAKHTPTPWRVGAPPEKVCAEGFTANGSAKTICTINDAKWMGVGEQWANAEFIVRAVNSHADMLAALKEAQVQIEYLHGKFSETGSGNAVLAQIGIALSRASSKAS